MSDHSFIHSVIILFISVTVKLVLGTQYTSYPFTITTGLGDIWSSDFVDENIEAQKFLMTFNVTFYYLVEQ